MNVGEMSIGRRSILMRLYAAYLDEFVYPVDLVDTVIAEELVGLGLVMIHPSHAEITEYGVIAWEAYCVEFNPHWRRPMKRVRDIGNMRKSKRLRAS